MDESVKNQDIAAPDNKESSKEFNFRRLETEREKEREARIRAEMEAQMLKQQIAQIEQRLAPKENDPLDHISDDDVLDKKTFVQKLEKEKERLRKEAEKIVDEKLEQKFKQKEASSYEQRLRQEFNDFDKVLNQDSIVKLQESNPEFLQSLMYVQDDYERRKLAYQFLKKNQPKQEEKSSIKEKVEQNQRNPYMIPYESGATPSAIDFDIKSKAARDAAYARLKSAQKRPVGLGNNVQ